jgi:hypothetical protein
MKSSHILPLYLVPTTALLLAIVNRATANVEYRDVSNANLDEAFGFKLAAESRHGSSIYSDRVVEIRRRRRRRLKRRRENSSSRNESKDEDGEPIEIIAERTKSILHGAALHLSTFGERAVDDAGGLVETLGGGKNEWPPTENEMKQSDDRHYK